jgi:dienelactone hydrolase
MNAFIKNSMIKVLTVALLIVAQLFIITAHAQPTPRNLAGDANSAPDLVFPSEPTPILEANYPKMMLLKTAGKPLQIHTYPNETHCWDCKSLNGFTKPGRLGTVTYTYSETATVDAYARTRQFLEESFKSQ